MLDNKKLIEMLEGIDVTKELLVNNYNNSKEIKSIFKRIYYMLNGIHLYKMKLQYIYLFTPLPKYFSIVNNNYSYSHSTNKYSSNKYLYNTILMGNIILPHHSLCPIPFLFQHKFNNKFIYSISNVFYFELTINKISTKESYENESIAIGFGVSNTPINHNYVGWSRHTIGYHSDDGFIYADNIMIGKSDKFTNGDTVGAGLIYLSKNM